MRERESARRRDEGEHVESERAWWSAPWLSEVFSLPQASGAGPGKAAPESPPVSARSSAARGEVEVSGLYIISVAARLLRMHPQTLRKYERAGLIRPSRTVGMLRLYSERDLARLRLIRRLVDDWGLNLAGVSLLMQLVDRLRQILALLEDSPETARTVAGGRAIGELRSILTSLTAENETRR